MRIAHPAVLTSVPGAKAFIYGFVRMCFSPFLTWAGPSLPVVATSGVVNRQMIIPPEPFTRIWSCRQKDHIQFPICTLVSAPQKTSIRCSRANFRTKDSDCNQLGGPSIHAGSLPIEMDERPLLVNTEWNLFFILWLFLFGTRP